MKPRPQRLHHGLWIGRYGIHFSYSTRDQRCVMFVSTPEKGQYSETVFVNPDYYRDEWRREMFRDLMGATWEIYCECNGYQYNKNLAIKHVERLAGKDSVGTPA